MPLSEMKCPPRFFSFLSGEKCPFLHFLFLFLTCITTLVVTDWLTQCHTTDRSSRTDKITISGERQREVAKLIFLFHVETAQLFFAR